MKEPKLPASIDPGLYLNRWIAVVRERVVGVGLTARQAHRAAKQTRPKDEPQVFFVGIEGTLKNSEMKNEGGWLSDHPLLRKTVEILRANQIEAYLVGGAVRDLLLGRQDITDLDFAVPGDGLAIARQVADALQGAFYPLDPERRTGRVVYGGPESPGPQRVFLDFATFRGPTLLADLNDRDFTINAIALSLSDPPELIDPLRGLHGLEIGQIQAVSETAFSRDPMRVVRAIRLAAELDYSIGTTTQRFLRQAASGLSTVSPERKRDELLKLLNTPAPDRAVRMLHQLGVLPHLLPEVEATIEVSQSPPHYLDVFDHTLTALRAWTTMLGDGFSDIPTELQPKVTQHLGQLLAGNVTQQALMPLALLLHDTGKPLTQTQEIQADNRPTFRFLGHEQASAKIARGVIRRFRFSSQAAGFVETVVANHLRPILLANQGKASRRAIYRLFRDTNGGTYQAGVAVALHALADHRATYPPGSGQAEKQALLGVVNKLLAAYFERRDQMVDPPPLLTGRELIDELGLTEGRLIGTLLNRLKEAQAIGQVQDKASAWVFIKQLLADNEQLRNENG